MKNNMDIQSLFKLKNKKAVSTVIATVLLILLVTASMAIVWTLVNNFVREKTENKCSNVQLPNEVTIEDSYTCYNITSNGEEVQFSINIGDVDIDSLVISILIGGNSKSFTLTNDNTAYQDIRPYQGNYGDPVKLPGKNEGRTYIANGFSETGEVESIEIAPIISARQCDATDEIYQVENCSMLGG